MNQEMNLEGVKEPFKQASPEVQRIIKRVLDAEKAKQSFKNPRYITDELLKIIEEEIR